MFLVKKKMLRLLILVSITSLTTSAYAGELKSPGNCSSKQHADLQSAVKTNCEKPKMSCSGSDSLATNKVTINILQKCINSRKLINSTCFNGGDTGHKKQVAERQVSLNNCKNYK